MPNTLPRAAVVPVGSGLVGYAVLLDAGADHVDAADAVVEVGRGCGNCWEGVGEGEDGEEEQGEEHGGG